MFNPAVLLLPFFWLGILMVLAYGFALLYHWFRFEYMYPLVWIALPIYVVGTIILVGGMLAGLGAV